MPMHLYTSMTHNGKTALEHRVVAELALGKSLPPKAVVHHRDDNPRNNAPSNLVICQDQKYHFLLHVRQRVLRAGGNPNTDRICWKCKAVKPMTDFYKRVSKTTSEGIMKHCKQCDNDQHMMNRRHSRRARGARVNGYRRALAVAVFLFTLSAVSVYAQPIPSVNVTPPVFVTNPPLSAGGGFSPQLFGPESCTVPAYSFTGAATSGYGFASSVLCPVIGGASVGSLTATAWTLPGTITFATTGGTITANRTALGTTSTDGLRNVNTTAATGGTTVQISPRTLWQGTAWDTAASQTVAFFAETLPATAATPTGTWKLGYSLNGAAASYPLTVGSTGIVMTGGGGAGTPYLDPTSSLIGWIGRSLIFSNTDGELRFANNATTGFSRVTYGASGGATSVSKLQKAVAAIANAAATDIFTVTVPNAQNMAGIEVSLNCSLGAGGAIGAGEASASIIYNFAVTRTAGVATVAAASTAYGSAAVAVAGAATVTVTAAATAMTGLVSATQTFTIQATVSRSGGSSTNHTCRATAEILNALASGITIS